MKTPFCPPDEANQLAKSVMPYAKKAAWQYADNYKRTNRLDHYNQFLSAALTGIAVALVNFKPEYGYKFFTYAKYCIDSNLKGLEIKFAKEYQRFGSMASFDYDDKENEPIDLVPKQAEWFESDWENLLNHLPCKRYRLVVDFRYRLGMQLGEISELLPQHGFPKVSREAVRNVLERCHAIMRQYYLKKRE